MVEKTRALKGRARGTGTVVIAFCCLLTAAPAVTVGDVPPPPSSLVRKPPVEPREDMPEALRAQVDAIVVLAPRNPADEQVSGSYGKDTYGLMGGVAAGHEAGRITKEIGPVPVSMRIPGTAIPGMIIGGLLGSAQREVQELRDALTEELSDAGNTPLSDDGLALDVFHGLRRVPGLDAKFVAPTAPVPEQADAMLHVNFEGVAIDVQGGDAVITTTAFASLRRLSDDVHVYATIVRYQDRDSLGEWTEDDNRLWHTYVNYARHYLGREIAARVYNRIDVPQTLTPEATDSVRSDRKDPLHFTSKSPQPELAWRLEVADVPDGALPGGAAGLDESLTRYDVEVYDRNRLVVFQEGVPGPRYTVPMPLECGEYRWSVRPSWRIDGTARYGHWMRFPPEPAQAEGEADDEKAVPPPNGLRGRAASKAPAYTQDFPRLTIECGRRRG